MSNNAMWWVHYTDKNTGFRGLLSLSSPDLKNSRAAHKRARDTAAKRLKAKGMKPVGLSSQCVG